MPQVGIYEDKFYQEAAKVYTELNSPEQIERGNFYRREYLMLFSEMQNRLTQWQELERLYQCDRDFIPDAPNSFIPVITPIINGQIAALVEKNVQATVRGQGLSDQNFAHTGQILADLITRECNIKQRIKEGAKDYLLYGTGCFSIGWNPDAFRGGAGDYIGFPEIRVPTLSRIMIDGKIKNLADFQKAEWVIEEVGFKSINWVRRQFGDDKADAVLRVNHVYPFDGDVTYDDINATSILYVWTRNNKHGNLQRIVMDKRGFILDESDSRTPYYDFVNNEYPYAFFGLYKKEERFHRFGDGLLLKPIQETINNLFDELITACKFAAQPRTFIDPQGACDPDDFDNDPSHPITCRNPRENVVQMSAATINPVVERLLSLLFDQAQKATRFSSLMSGNNPTEQMTATQAGIQVQQGNNTVNDKRMDVSDAIEFAVKYAIGLIMEFWVAAQALRLAEDKDEFEWIDVRQLASVPVMVPADSKFKEMWQMNHPNSPSSEAPKWMQLIVNDGGQIEPATKSVDFDLKISIGEGLPTSKLSLYNLLLSLAQVSLIDESTGQPRPLIGYQHFKNMAEDLLGLNLEDANVQMAQPMMQNANGGVVPNNGKPQALNMSGEIPGMNIAGQATGQVPVV